MQKSREDVKKEKELLEARKNGTVPAELDEDGKEINPHIPQYMASTPWYYGQTGPTLKHQRSQTINKFDKLGTWYARGQIQGPAATKFRKGACPNCGSLTHGIKECTERPRKIGAQFTGKGIAPDEVAVDVNLDYDGKRDRWNGYDSSNHRRNVDEYERIEAERRAIKTKQLEEQHATDAVTSKTLDDDLKQKAIIATDEKNQERDLVSKADPRTRAIIRNLRIREDTAKYLWNLNVNSAFYDPKTRSMRENPHPHKNPDEVLYSGDNFARNSGEALEWTKMQCFCWEASDLGNDVHLQAAPSHAETAYKTFQERRTQLKAKQRSKVLEEYGGEDHLRAPPPELIYGQTEAFLEYNRDGKPVKPQEKKTEGQLMLEMKKKELEEERKKQELLEEVERKEFERKIAVLQKEMTKNPPLQIKASDAPPLMKRPRLDNEG